MALYNISTYSQYTEVLIGFMLCHTTSIFRQIAQIEYFSYAYFRVLFLACERKRHGDANVDYLRVLFLACDGRRRGDPNVFFHADVSESLLAFQNNLNYLHVF